MTTSSVDTLSLADSVVASFRVAIVDTSAVQLHVPLNIVLSSPAGHWWSTALFQTL